MGECIDGDALTDEERASLYVEQAVRAAGNRYSIRGIFGSRTQGCGPDLGVGTPALFVSVNDRPVDVGCESAL